MVTSTSIVALRQLATITLGLNKTFMPNTSTIKGVIEKYMVPNFLNLQRVDRAIGSDKFEITFLPNKMDRTASWWATQFESFFKAAGYPDVQVFELTAGTQAKDPGGLLAGTQNILIGTVEKATSVPTIQSGFNAIKWAGIGILALAVIVFSPQIKSVFGVFKGRG